MDLGIAGRTAAVAGASSGLGFEAARALAAAGCRVVICARTRDRIETAAERIGEAAVPVVRDVSTADGGRRFVEEAERELGRVDILVPNTGGPPPGAYDDVPLDAYPDALSLSLLSVVGMCTAAIPGMRRSGFGRIVAITSIAVREPISHLILSNTARAGTTAFLKTLARDVAGDGITVNSVQPGYHATDRLTDLPDDARDRMLSSVPAGRLGAPADLGHTVAYLCSTHASYITGAAIPVDGGLHAGLQ